MTSESGSSTPDSSLSADGPTTSWRGIAAFLFDIMCTAMGAGAALALTMFVLMPVLGVGNVERVVALGHHIESGDAPMVVMLGNSVTVEGLDAGVVAAEIGRGATAENWGINGSALQEVRLLLPKVLAAHPRYVVLTLMSSDIANPQDIDSEKAYGYGAGGFGSAWPDGEFSKLFPGMTRVTRDPIVSGPLEQAIYFRSTLLDWLNRQVRMAVRPGIRRVRADEWRLPFELTGGISGDRLDAHARQVEDMTHMRTDSRDGSGARVIAAAAETIVAGGARAVLCIAPQHPILRETLAPEMSDLRATVMGLSTHPGVAVLDASQLFGAEGFADVLHPNATGREAYSRAVGEVIAGMERRGEGD